MWRVEANVSRKGNATASAACRSWSVRIRDRMLAAGFEYLSTLIEERIRETAPGWLRRAVTLDRIDNYLRSGVTFAYLQTSLQPSPELEHAGAPRR